MTDSQYMYAHVMMTLVIVVVLIVSVDYSL